MNFACVLSHFIPDTKSHPNAKIFLLDQDQLIHINSTTITRMYPHPAPLFNDTVICAFSDYYNSVNREITVGLTQHE